ncbi:EamA family transporter [Pseudoclavibacter helvolus]
MAGLLLVGVARGGAGSWWPFLLVVFGAFGWAIGNISSRLAEPPKPLHLTMWMAVVPPIPMLAVSLLVEGPDQIWSSLATAWTAAAVPAWVGLVYTIVLGTVLGSGIWVWLMKRHPAGVVAPFSMLVPVVGISTAWLVLGERPGPLELVGGAIVLFGVLWASKMPAAALVLEPESSIPAPPSDPPADPPVPDTPKLEAAAPR